jgi:polygalacturonase
VTPTPAVTFDVKSYGAKGDGIADDAGAIQKAVDACAAAGGGIVYLPAGEYRLYGARTANPDLAVNVELKDGVHLQGAGAGQTKVTATRTSANAIGASQKTNVGVSDLEVSSTISGIDGVKLYCCDQATVEDVVAHNLYIGIAVYGCQDSSVVDCTSYNNSSMGISMSESYLGYQTTQNGLVANCLTYGNQLGVKVGGYIPSSPNPHRVGDVTLRSCRSHDNSSANYWLSYAEDLALSSCAGGGATYKDIVVAGVLGAQLTDSPTAYVVTATNNPSWYSTYGASTDIVQQ